MTSKLDSRAASLFSNTDNLKPCYIFSLTS
jgi:hypothetical protein